MCQMFHACDSKRNQRRNSDIFPKKIHFPETSVDDFLKQAAFDIISILTNPPNTSTCPSLRAGDATRNALLDLAKLLHNDKEIEDKEIEDEEIEDEEIKEVRYYCHPPLVSDY